ncbi:hypothetical protein ACFVXG_14905 [Kitasatospora sp. NPDC058162]|uniref:hypothetical protein n=1 Tax=Kitasatospora sp. NPDC058162 TaxID=3346362 RepID=UPI0036D76188
MLTHQAHRAPGADGHRWYWCAGWLASAAWAAAFPLVSSLGPHRTWGTVAAVGYLAAAVTVLLPSRRDPRTGSTALALSGAVVLPLLLLVHSGAAQSEVGVIERSGSLLVHQVSPYLDDPRTVGEVTPYLPAMALLGVPRALLGADGLPARLAGDPRVWCAAVLLGGLWLAHRLLRAAAPDTGAAAGPDGGPDTGPDDGRRWGAVPAGQALAALVASPVVALPLAVSGVDLPLTGLLCLALALAAVGRPAATGLVLAAACAMKWTAWPAVAVAVALLAATAGRRAAGRCLGTALVGTAALVLPAAVLAPGPMVDQVLAFPLGRGGLRTEAASPLPGKLLADLGTAGWCAAVALLLLGGLGVAVSLVRRPPRDLVAAADRLALGLGAAFLLAPAGRFGYLALPAVLALWARVMPAPRPAGPVPAPIPVPVRQGGAEPTTTRSSQEGGVR